MAEIKAVLDEQPVEITPAADSATLVKIDSGLIKAPQTTEEEDRKTASQREVNLIWETTQMRVALSVIWASLLVSSVLATAGKYLGTPDLQLAAIVFLFGVANLVTGFYFGRTNHQRVGGVGGDNAGTR